MVSKVSFNSSDFLSVPNVLPVGACYRSGFTFRLTDVSVRKPFTVTLNKTGTSPFLDTLVFLMKNRILKVFLSILFKLF